jgi:hypothetical protein
MMTIRRRFPAGRTQRPAVTDEEIANYRRDGWARLPGLIPAGVAAEMLEVGRAHLADNPPASGAQSLDLPMWREWRYLARDVGQEPRSCSSGGRPDPLAVGR